MGMDSVFGTKSLYGEGKLLEGSAPGPGPSGGDTRHLSCFALARGGLRARA